MLIFNWINYLIFIFLFIPSTLLIQNSNVIYHMFANLFYQLDIIIKNRYIFINIVIFICLIQLHSQLRQKLLLIIYHYRLIYRAMELKTIFIMNFLVIIQPMKNFVKQYFQLLLFVNCKHLYPAKCLTTIHLQFIYFQLVINIWPAEQYLEVNNVNLITISISFNFL